MIYPKIDVCSAVGAKGYGLCNDDSFSIYKLNQMYFSRLSRFYIRHYNRMGT